MGRPNDGLPTYEEVISQETGNSNTPPLPARPQTHSESHSYSYTTSQTQSEYYGGAPPQQPPRPSNNNNNNLPFTYPPRYYCRKCRNTGYKIKNGHKCKTCWSKFYTPPPPAPAPPVTAVPVTAAPITVAVNPSGIVYGPVNPVPGPAPAAPNANPIYVRPGDPRIGGFLCPTCNGTGQVRFLLDKVPCVDCHGVGRVFNAYHRPY
ncbi:hypothetical protein KLMA_10489 [Kluyveromyces marxianus]|uniref:Proline-rich protein HUA1 n=1 Tax=Kluyveromyces marxianus (strain DMKU3-1042 / BCC 29191 / NBRC 104275) TaxID=1003335 RepID=W0T5L2_KLUMD|nr:hypothetical protein KLMA_10489 [Kluyveromyces marxianus DMKU3-1042]BAO38111.1 hypothetical protein KLMA_10489 [Kluyveromyces marxianus DMKU3-1042]BAP69679.1 hypothetical protein KLMA_10489 [Kluyveromyces marxianus]